MTVNLMKHKNGKVMIQIANFKSVGRTSLYHGVPASMRDEVLTYFKSSGVKVKLRYRGPRAHRRYRSSNSRSTTCLMCDATSFAVYSE
jgi:hypothetical protein